MPQHLAPRPAAPFKNTTNRLDALLALRGFASLMIVAFHCAAPRESIIYKNHDLSWLLFSHGLVGVWILFALSGYLMGKVFYTDRYTADLPGVLNFWRNRLLRICPLYYFAILILSLFVYPHILKPENWATLLRLLTFTYNQVLPPADFNITLWAISTEVQFYLIAPFIYTFFKSRLQKPRQVILAAGGIALISFGLRLAIWIALRNQIHEKTFYYLKYSYNPLLTNLDIFLLGFLVNAWIQTTQRDYLQAVTPDFLKKLRVPKLPGKTLAVALIVWLYLFTAYHIYHQELWRLPGRAGGVRTTALFFLLPVLTAWVTSFFIFAFESGGSYWAFQQTERLSFDACLKNPSRLLEVFGNLSYGIYIWHVPINRSLAPIFTSEIPVEAFYFRLTSTLLMSALLASVTYYLVEIPAGRLKTFRKS